MKILIKGLKKVFKRISLRVLVISLFTNFLFLDYFLLTRTTSWESFLIDNNQSYVFGAIFLSLVNNSLIAIVLTQLVFVLEERKKYPGSFLSNSLIGTFLSLISVGCAVCGGFLLPLLGVAASLTAFPLMGLEIKLLSIIILLYSINELNRRIVGVFAKNNQVKRWSYLIGVGGLLLVYLIPRLPYSIKSYFTKTSLKGVVEQKSASLDQLFEEINPSAGYELKVSYGDLGPKMIKGGVIDFDKFQQVYQQSGQPLTEEQIEILTKGTNKKIKIDRQNSYFLLNFFWAAGLANKSKILTEGEIVKYGEGQVGSFASTGGWTLSKTQPMDYYARFDLIPLTADQEVLVEKVAAKIYRPCCNNSTAFPDCNHGMALLAVLQLLAADGASEREMFETAKYFNAYWFPSNYYDLALYFKNKEGKSFAQIPGEVILGKDYSSASGWSAVKKWLADKGLIKQPPATGGTCGV